MARAHRGLSRRCGVAVRAGRRGGAGAGRAPRRRYRRGRDPLLDRHRDAEARPGTNVLMVAVELCTLAFRLDDFKVANLIATALFGDGCAACVLRADEGGPAEIEGRSEHNWRGALDGVGWPVGRRGFGVVLARSVPPFVEERFAPALDDMLAQLGITA